MPKTYVGRDNSGSTVKGAGTVASGPILHKLYKGPTLGYAYDYSGVVTGPVLFVVENGSTLGRQHSTT